MAETLEFNDVYQEVKGSMVRRAPRREGSSTCRATGRAHALNGHAGLEKGSEYPCVPRVPPS